MTATATASPRPSPTHAVGLTPGLRLAGISKSFGRQKVLTDLDLSAYPGRVYGLLGLNGAGKSTAFNIALGLLTPDAGRVEIQELRSPVAAWPRWVPPLTGLPFSPSCPRDATCSSTAV